jgi:transcriptional regulator
MGQAKHYMYIPRAFAEERPEVIAQAIRAARVGELVTMGPDGIDATPVPLLLEPRGAHGTLVGHLARANPQWRSFDAGVEALVIFRPADAYVSPSLYPTKQADGRVVPTWNYVTVHAWGAADRP